MELSVRSRAVGNKMTASESDMSSMRRLSELCSKQTDEALKSHASHATKLADTSKNCLICAIYCTARILVYEGVKGVR